MKGHEDIESYLLRLGVGHERLTNDVWNLKVNQDENLVISFAGPVLVFRLKLMQVPTGNREALFEELLRLNTTEVVHGAFGLEGDAVVLTAALPLENLDFNEFQSVVDDMTMAVNKLYPQLARYREAA